MLTAIHFDDQAGFEAHKVHNVIADWYLTPELIATNLAIAQMPPQGSFCISLIAPKDLCESVHACSCFWD